MKLLSQRLDRFITLCHAVTNSEDSLVKRSEQISALMAKQNDCSLVIEEQQTRPMGVRKKAGAPIRLQRPGSGAQTHFK